MMNSYKGKMMMTNHENMLKMMKDNPDMMKGMMTEMMEASKTDTTMMSEMCKSMMDNPKMIDMMKDKKMQSHKMTGMDKNMDMSK